MKINENGHIEPEIGDVFKDGEISLSIIESPKSCEECFYFNFDEERCPPIACLREERSDGKYVAFKQVEK